MNNSKFSLISEFNRHIYIQSIEIDNTIDEKKVIVEIEKQSI